MKTRHTRSPGFTLVEIMIVVAIIGLLCAIAIPNFVRARTTTQKNSCISNLRVIDAAIQQWALEFKKGGNDPVAYADISDYMKNNVICPSGGTDFGSSYTVVDPLTPTLCKKQPATHKVQ